MSGKNFSVVIVALSSKRPTANNSTTIIMSFDNVPAIALQTAHTFAENYDYYCVLLSFFANYVEFIHLHRV